MTPSETPPPAGFDAAWQVASGIPGWCTREQAQALWDAADRLRPGALVLEIGSHQGRSTVVLARAVQPSGGRVAAVDPFVEGRLFGGQPTRERFEQHLLDAGVTGAVELHPEFSRRLRPRWRTPLDLVYVDGKHDYWTVRDDLRWGEHVPPGGELLVHDSFSSIGVTLGLLATYLLSREWSYVGRTGSLALFRRTPPTARDRARMLAELPWWLRNVVIKVLLRLRLRPVARALGHDGDYDPY